MAAVRKTKKDFNKDQMYKKIMPSLQTVPADSRVSKVYDGIDEAEELLLSKPAEEPQSLEIPVATQHGITNLMESIVLDKMTHTMKVLRACECSRCHADIMAIALNQLPSVYAVIEDTEARERKLRTLRMDYEVKVTAALIKAVQTVKISPRHED